MMKARQAKKILRQQPENDLPLHKINLYWIHRWDRYNQCVHPCNWVAQMLGSRGDARIQKAVSLASRWEKKKFKQTH